MIIHYVALNGLVGGAAATPLWGVQLQLGRGSTKKTKFIKNIKTRYSDSPYLKVLTNEFSI